MLEILSKDYTFFNKSQIHCINIKRKKTYLAKTPDRARLTLTHQARLKRRETKLAF